MQINDWSYVLNYMFCMRYNKSVNGSVNSKKLELGVKLKSLYRNLKAIYIVLINDRHNNLFSSVIY